MQISELTPKQRNCAVLAAQGICNSEIAELTGVKVRTVKATLGRVFARFGIRNGHKRTRLAAVVNSSPALQAIPPFRIGRKTHAIASLVAAGLKHKEVAVVLGTTEHVVKNYMRFLYDLSGMSNRTEFCAWWLANHKAAVPWDPTESSHSDHDHWPITGR
jgi:DNA-binding CsgD family transcriptional regulator